MNEKNFFLKRLFSFKYAFNGILYFIKSQKNAWIHLFFVFFVTIFGVILKITLIDWILVLFCFGFVLTAEAFNTAIEKIVDFVSPEFQKEAGIIKDVAAGAVLISAIISAIIGLIIFIPKLISFSQNLFE